MVENGLGGRERRGSVWWVRGVVKGRGCLGKSSTKFGMNIHVEFVPYSEGTSFSTVINPFVAPKTKLETADSFLNIAPSTIY